VYCTRPRFASLANPGLDDAASTGATGHAATSGWLPATAIIELDIHRVHDEIPVPVLPDACRQAFVKGALSSFCFRIPGSPSVRGNTTLGVPAGEAALDLVAGRHVASAAMAGPRGPKIDKLTEASVAWCLHHKIPAASNKERTGIFSFSITPRRRFTEEMGGRWDLLFWTHSMPALEWGKRHGVELTPFFISPDGGAETAATCRSIGGWKVRA
jgi:hypothetical protein